MLVKFSFDDGSKEDMRLAELMYEYGFKDVIFYIPSEWQTYNKLQGREPLSTRDVGNLSLSFSIGSHSVSHPLLTRIPFEEAKWEIEESKNSLTILLDKDIDSFCAPRGYSNPQLQNVIGQHYRTARNTLVGNIDKSEDPLWETPSVHIAGQKRKEYENITWQEEAYRLLEKAAKIPDSVYHLWGHSWELSRYDAWHDFEELLKEIKKHE